MLLNHIHLNNQNKIILSVMTILYHLYNHIYSGCGYVDNEYIQGSDVYTKNWIDANYRSSMVGGPSVYGKLVKNTIIPLITILTMIGSNDNNNNNGLLLVLFSSITMLRESTASTDPICGSTYLGTGNATELFDFFAFNLTNSYAMIQFWAYMDDVLPPSEYYMQMTIKKLPWSNTFRKSTRCYDCDLNLTVYEVEAGEYSWQIFGRIGNGIDYRNYTMEVTCIEYPPECILGTNYWLQGVTATVYGDPRFSMFLHIIYFSIMLIIIIKN